MYIDPGESSLVEIGQMVIGGEEAHHAIRVKRLQKGDVVEVLDGRGNIVAATVAETAKTRSGWQLRVDVRSVDFIPEIQPSIRVHSPSPKGSRLADMIDGLSQAGAAMWSPMATALSVVDPRPGKLERLERTAAEASKQCGRPWLLQIGESSTFRKVLEARSADDHLVLADATGDRYTASNARTIHLLVGPEGGWRNDELEAARAADIPVARFGPFAMRIETAAMIATAVVLDIETHQR